MKKLIIPILLFFFALPALADVLQSDDYDSYGTGGLNGKGSWVSDGWTVTNSDSVSSPNSMQTITADYAQITSSSTDGYFVSFDFKYNGPSAKMFQESNFNYIVSFQTSTSSPDLMDIWLNIGDGQPFLIYEDIATSTWHDFYVYKQSASSTSYTVYLDSVPVEIDDSYYQLPTSYFKWYSNISSGLLRVDNFQSGIEYWDTLPDLSYPYSVLCWYNEDCAIEVYYNATSSGGTLNLTPADDYFPENAVDSVYLEYGEESAFLYMPATTTVGTWDACLFLEHISGDQVYCGITFEVLEEDWWHKTFDACSADTVCYDIASTSILYDVQCGSQVALCKAFNPSQASFTRLFGLKDEFANTAPFSIFYDIADGLEVSTSTETSSIMGIIDNSGLQGLFDIIRNMFFHLLWLVFAFIVFRRLTRFKIY